MSTQTKVTYVAIPRKRTSGAFAEVFYGTRYLASLYAPNNWESKVAIVLITQPPDFKVDPPVYCEAISLYADTFNLDHTLNGLASLLPPL